MFPFYKFIEIKYLWIYYTLLLVAESDSEEDDEEEEEFDSEGEEGEDGEVSSQSSDRRYPSRSTRLTRNSAAGDRKRAGKCCSLPSAVNPALSVLNPLVCDWLAFRVQSRGERSQQQAVSQGAASPPRL